MTTLRATQKVLRYLPSPRVSVAEPPRNALGDWYVTRTVVDRQPLLVLISELGYLPIVVPAREVRLLPEVLPELVAARLERTGVPTAHRRAEVLAMRPVSTGPTANRSTTGILVDFVRCLPSHLPEGGWGDEDLRSAEDHLGEMPCHAGRADPGVVFPLRDTARLLAARWGAG